MKKILLVLGVLLLASAGIWKYTLSPRYEMRFSPDWTWEYDTLGTWAIFEGDDESVFDESTDNDELAASTFSLTVSSEDFSPDSAILNSYYADVDTLTGEIDYEYSDTIAVNPTTGLLLDPELSDYYALVFPRNLQKQNVQLYDGYYGVMDFEFIQEEVIGGLTTYKFTFATDLNETTPYVEDGYIEEGTGVVCYDMVVHYWIEPTTGEVVNFEEICPREYWVDPVTLENISPYGRWTVTNSGDSIQRAVAIVQSRLNTYQWMTLYAPIALAVAGAIFLLLGFFLPTSSDTVSKSTPK